ncbi:MAG: hypothetical protein M1388_03055 [Thaumarchaeota archaeon]|nr:hypothetical protein [Nitrososphaerota archaeon]
MGNHLTLGAGGNENNVRYANIATDGSSIIMTQEQCKHDVRYAGVLNLLHGFGILGAVDVWECAKCGQIWCDEKRLGVQDLSPHVGFPPNEPDSEWAILVCRDGEKLEWHLLQVKKGAKLEHNCEVFNTTCNIEMVDGKAVCDLHKEGHTFFSVKDNINRSIKV